MQIMTRKKLNRLYYINRDIERLQNRIDEMTAIAEGTTQRITGLPGGCSGSDKVGNGATRIAVLRIQLEAAKADAQMEYEEITTFIENEEDPLMRQILQYRHINGLKWRQVNTHIGGCNTEASIRQMYKRFLDRNNIK